MAWIQHPVILEGSRVKLEPLENSHFEPLAAIAGHEDIWRYLPADGTDRSVLYKELQSAILKRMSGEQYPFAVIDKQTGRVAGSTRLFDLSPEHRKLEIGWTWYDPACWGTGINPECKYLLLAYCFETLAAKRVQLKTRSLNLRSRTAIEKIGAKLEGVLRNDRIGRDGTSLDTHVFSVIEAEWPGVKSMLRSETGNDF